MNFKSVPCVGKAILPFLILRKIYAIFDWFLYIFFKEISPTL